MSGCRDKVKVVIINTQFVETDPSSFKSVVQSLTGKGSPAEAAAAGEHHSSERTAAPEEAEARGSVGFEHLGLGVGAQSVDWIWADGLLKEMQTLVDPSASF